MHCQKPSRQSRPYQGVRVKDPVKELLRRKRSLDLQNTRAEVISENQTSYPQVNVSPARVTDGQMQCADYKSQPPPASVGLQSTPTHWPSDLVLQDPSTQTATYVAAPSLAADRCMPTLCPSYTMLTYTHAPVLTNFRTIPVAPAASSISHTPCPETGLTFIPWAQSFTTMCSPPGPPLISSSAAPPLRHMPLPLSLSTQLQMLNHHQIDPDSSLTLDEDAEVKPPSPNLLDELLEDREEQKAVESRDFPFCL